MAELLPKKDIFRFSTQRPVDERTDGSIREMAVLFTDIVGSTKYFKSHGDLAGREMLQRHQDLVSTPIDEHSGVLVKTLGDSVLAYFLDPKEAVKSAIKIQQKFMLYNKKREPDDQIHVRIGIHFGEGIVEEQDIFGNVVNLAAKIVTLVDSDQIYISQEVYDLVYDLSSVNFELIDRPDKEEVPRGFTIYRVVCDKRINFDQRAKILLYLKPLWNLSKDDFAGVWNNLLGAKDNFWSGKIDKESILSNKTVVLIVKEVSLSIAVASDILAFIRNKLESNDGFSLLPVQIIIDSGPYLKGDKLTMESLKVNWDEIDPGEIYISSSVYRVVKDKRSFSTEPQFDTSKPQTFYKLILNEHLQKSKACLFLYQSVLIRGNNSPCYYCGDRRHLTMDCPSKKLGGTTDALKKLGYLSVKTINKLFFNYLTGADRDNKEGMKTLNNAAGSVLLAHDAFYELKSVFQLRFFRTIWDSNDENWERIKNRKNGGHKGGLVWLAQDCIRVSNLLQAENLLGASMKENPKDYKVYCAMGFLNIEKNDFNPAQYYFNRALDCAATKPVKIFILFLLSRLYYLNGDFFRAEKRIREIILLDRQCSEAMYQRIIFKFHKGFDANILAELIKFIREYREYYVNALIDPELAPFNKIIHPELKRLYTRARKEAEQIVPEAEKEFERLEKLLGEKEEKIVAVRSLLKKIKELSKTDGYVGYLDIANYADSILSMSRRIIKDRERKIYDLLYDLNNQCGKHLAFVNKFPYKSLTGVVYNQLKFIQKEIDKITNTLTFDTYDNYKKTFNHAGKLSAQIAKIDLKLRRLECIRKIFYFLSTFFKKSLIIQSVNIFIVIILFPIIAHYLVFILPELRAIYQDLWFYQKTFLVIGGISGILLALIMTIKKLYPE